MSSETISPAQRVPWLEILQALAVLWLSLYQAHLLFTGYVHRFTPVSLWPNLQDLLDSGELSERGWGWQVVGVVSRFGYQGLGVFVLLYALSLVLSLQGRPLRPGKFLSWAVGRLLLPYWIVALLAYPTLWAIAQATDSYAPDAWHSFAGLTFPLLFDYSGRLLERTNPTWWFVPLLLQLTLLFPLLWHLLQRWGVKNLVLVSTLLTLLYRSLAVGAGGAHPPYVLVDTGGGWQPFASALAHLSTFVIGMGAAAAYQSGRGVVFWRGSQGLGIGLGLYGLGFLAQFYRWGWVVADLLLPLGLGLVGMVGFRRLTEPSWLQAWLTWLGKHSYTYYLLHYFVIDRTIKLVIRNDVKLYTLLLPVMVLGTFVLAMLVEAMVPFWRRLGCGIWRDLDFILQRSPHPPPRRWQPQVGEVVIYQDRSDWRVLKREPLLDEQEIWLCQVTDGQRSLWVAETELEPSETQPDQEEATYRRIRPDPSLDP